jgi:DNA primase
VRAEDVDHPDELRVDLDPVRGVPWSDVREVALVTRDVLSDFGLVGWPKTSGSRGFHVFCRIEPRWTFPEVRNAAVALAREVERRAPELATSKWWKEERHGVFVDYNQNAKDHTTASAYSVRPTADARVSAPLAWSEVPSCDPAAFTLDTVPGRFAEIGDPGEDIDASVGSLDGLLELYQQQPEPSGPRKVLPLVEIARAATQQEALAGLERWRARHEDVWPLLEPNDILIDGMRGRSTTWTRIRVNLQHVPEDLRPPQEPLEVDYNPWAFLDRRSD